MDDLVRLENAASRAVKALGAKRERRDPTPSLHEYLAATSEAETA